MEQDKIDATIKKELERIFDYKQFEFPERHKHEVSVALERVIKITIESMKNANSTR